MNMMGVDNIWHICHILAQMTDFNGIKRRTRAAYRVLYAEPRQIVVSLEPGDLIVFRESGRRQGWSLPADVAFRHAVHSKAWPMPRKSGQERINDSTRKHSGGGA
jgi:hypothetical protein